MAIDGRITVDALFHDADGTTSLKVVSLEDSTAYTTGKVVAEAGTVGTAAQFFTYASTYKNAAGELVSLTPQRFAFAATPAAQIQNDLGGVLCRSDNGDVVVDSWRDHVVVKTTAGTASYTLVLYGT